MSSVVIRPEDGQPDSLKALLAVVTRLAGAEPVTVGSGGVVVSRAVARKYLNAKTTDTANTAGYTVDNTRAPLVTQSILDPVPYPDPDPDRPVGGLTPEGDFPGGQPGTTPADDPAADRDPSAEDSGASTAEPSTPAKKAAPAKSTAAAQQRASRSTTRSNP